MTAVGAKQPVIRLNGRGKDDLLQVRLFGAEGANNEMRRILASCRLYGQQVFYLFFEEGF
jgi:hypothetical protein